MKRSLRFAIIAQAVSILVLVLLAFEFFDQISLLNEYSAKVERAYLVINQISNVRSSVKDAEAASRGYLLTGEKPFMKQLSQSASRVLPADDSLRKLIKDNPEEMALWKRINILAYEKTAHMLENTRLKTRISIDSINYRLQSGKVLMDSIDYYLEQMRKSHLKKLNERRIIKTGYEEKLPIYVRWVFLFAGLMTIVFGVWIFIELRKRFRFQSLLQVKLNELRQSNEELEQIAFAASHDLQEPLRKIRIFSDRLLIKGSPARTDEETMMLQRMNYSAARLQDLISDLVTFNQLVQNKSNYEAIDIKEAIKMPLEKLLETNPEISVQWEELTQMPIINASVEQLQVLFFQILHNAIQFAHADRNLALKISGSAVRWTEIKGLPSDINEGQFYRLTIKDNGVGFDESFKDRMFKPFQRLHNVDFAYNTRRKGMGLAMCKRVMINLGGWIDAEGSVNEGATILLYFPIT